MLTLKKIGIVLAVIGGVSFAPLVPEELTLLNSYQYPIASYKSSYQLITATSTTDVVNPQPNFPDGDGNGLVSVSVFVDGSGNKVFVQIPETQYAEMGGLDGYSKNPTKTELVNLIQLLTPKVDAAVAFGHASSAASSGTDVTSLTFAHDATSDSLLVLGIALRANNTTSQTATYAGVSMTQRSVKSESLSHVFIFDLASPTTGSNNIVVSWTTGARIGAGAVSFTGAGSTGTADPQSGTGLSPSTTVTLTADDMMFGVFGNPDTALSTSVTTGTERFEGVDGNFIGAFGATNAGTGSVSITWLRTGVDLASWIGIPVVATVAAVSAPTQDIIYFQ